MILLLLEEIKKFGILLRSILNLRKVNHKHCEKMFGNYPFNAEITTEKDQRNS